MGQKFSEFKKNFKMKSRREGSRLSSRKSGSSFKNDASDTSSSANQSSGCNSDSNGNVTSAVGNVNEQYDPVHISTCDNRIMEDNGNRNNSVIGEQVDQISSITPFTCNVLSVGPDTACKLVSVVKSDTGQKKCQKTIKDVSSSTQCKKKRNNWVLKFNCARLKYSNSSAGPSDNDLPESNLGCDACICTGYQKTKNYPLEADIAVSLPAPSYSGEDTCYDEDKDNFIEPVIDLSKFKFENYPIEDYDEKARKERAKEMAEGVEPPPGYKSHIHLVNPEQLLSSALDSFTALLHSAALSALSQLENTPQAHTQVDYMHCLVPDLLQITSCSFYWGKMDRYEAERLLEGLPEGAFLLRDSAQEEYLFSVSFRKYSRSLHARIEQWNHRFSFDCRDPGVFASSTVCGLIEHYKNLSCCMFFEPQLTIPLHRNFPFPLQHLCRATICSHISYDGINQLQLPKVLKSYLKEYHYKQRLRVRVLDPEP